MASTIDICNLALAHLGEIPNISSIDPPEGSAHAEKCERFYPIARDAALEMRNWSFALKRVTLASVENTNSHWAYKYALPSDMIRPVAIPIPGVRLNIGFMPCDPLAHGQQNSADFTTEGDYLFTQAEDAELLYLFRLTDTTKFKPLFVNSVAWLLASYLAGAITRDMDIKQWCYQMFERELSLSAQSMANGSQTTNYHTPSWISSR
jgi:hypothetical protein